MLLAIVSYPKTGCSPQRLSWEWRGSLKGVMLQKNGDDGRYAHAYCEKLGTFCVGVSLFPANNPLIPSALARPRQYH